MKSHFHVWLTVMNWTTYKIEAWCLVILRKSITLTDKYTAYFLESACKEHS